MIIFNFYRFFRHHIKRNPFLYKIFAKNLKSDARMADADTSAVIEGFQRSGNTFAWYLIKEIYGHEFKIAHHTHSVANLKLAIRYKKKTIILIRNPIDSIISSIIYRKKLKGNILKKNLIYFMDDYTSFYKFLNKVKGKNNFRIYNFSDLINKPIKFCNNTIQFLEKDSHLMIDHTFIEKVRKKQIKSEKKRNFPKLMSTSFNQFKNNLKPEIRKIIINEYSSKLKELNSIYSEVDYLSVKL